MRPNSSAPSSGVKDLEPNAKAMTATAAQPLPPRPISPTRWCGTWAGHFARRKINTDVYKVLSVENSVASRVSFGGTAPRNVAREAARWLKLLAKNAK